VLGRIEQQTLTHVLLSDASWIADEDTQLGDFIKSGITDRTEVEYCGKMLVPIASIDDAIVWNHGLPKRSQ
jgi:hypothetical protein